MSSSFFSVSGTDRGLAKWTSPFFASRILLLQKQRSGDCTFEDGRTTVTPAACPEQSRRVSPAVARACPELVEGASCPRRAGSYQGAPFRRAIRTEKIEA